MLNKKDLEAIKGVVHETVGEVMEELVLPKFAEIDARFDAVDGRFSGVEGRLDRVEGRLDRIESTMVTKDFLEERLADFKAELKNTGGKALRQIKRMAGELHRNGGLSSEQVVQITLS